jgi:hypothetical protein
MDLKDGLGWSVETVGNVCYSVQHHDISQLKAISDLILAASDVEANFLVVTVSPVILLLVGNQTMALQAFQHTDLLSCMLINAYDLALFSQTSPESPFRTSICSSLYQNGNPHVHAVFAAILENEIYVDASSCTLILRFSAFAILTAGLRES